MKTQLTTIARCLAAGVMLGVGLMASPAHALVVNLTAESYNATMPNGDVVTMWGYRTDAGGATTQSPGAQLVVPAADTTLTINLSNMLPMPTSIVVHGLNPAGGAAPVYTDIRLADSNTTASTCVIGSSRFCRLRSMTNEAAASDTITPTTATYTFNNVKPGTYMYQSGTLPQIQVQMGLYGMVTKNAVDANAASIPAVAGEAYPGLAFDNEVKLVFSEVDPAVHTAVSMGNFTGSTLDYQPKYFRVHSYDATGAVASLVSSANANQTINMLYNARQLVRLVNAGLQSRVPTLTDGTWYVVAEDGNPYPYAREQYTAFMPAAKTADLYFSRAVPAGGDTVTTLASMFDRRMAMATDALTGDVNGQFMKFSVNGSVPPPPPPPLPPLAVNLVGCATTGTQGVVYSCSAAANQGGVTFSLVTAPVGMTINAATGAIAWTPSNDQAQRPANPTITNPVVVRGALVSGSTVDATVTVTVANVNDAPTALTKAYRLVVPTSGVPSNPALTVAAANGLLVGAADIDGDALMAALASQPSPATVGTASNGTIAVQTNGSFTLSGYTAPAVPPTATPTSTDRVFTFTYTATDVPSALTPAPALNSGPTTVTITLHRNRAPQANNDGTLLAPLSTPRNTPLQVNVLANDTDADGTLNPATVNTFIPGNGTGTVSVNTTTGVVTFTPNVGYVGLAGFAYNVRDNDGAISNTALVFIRVTP